MNEEELRGKVEQLLLAEKIRQLREKGYEQEVRAFVLDAKEKQLEYEYRYNHYHDPHNGRFASAGAAGSGANYGQGLYYSMGKGKGEIVGAYSSLPKNIEKLPDTKTNDLTSNEKNDIIILPTEDQAYGNCSRMIKLCKDKHVDHNPVKTLEHELTEQEIIDRISGADKTKGSCASLAYAYAANKAGYDVLDFRGGDSLKILSDRDNTYRFSQCENSKWIYKGAATSFEKVKFIRSLPDGQEFIFMSGEHSAVVRQKEGKAQYLELQEKSSFNGWQTIRNSFDFDMRFNKGALSTSGYFAINTNDLVKSKGFREMCGYINTDPKNQMKGTGGYAK